ncbi:uncharacterized protein [Cardiocondyla obscurior]|uniref:uncharacterized protein n=1 Tax=Cardiocondyla obscurior TaxID=286306 RepID=UPI0039655B3D
MAGRLGLFVDKWKGLTSDQTVLEAVQGYRLPFVSLPPPRTFLKEREFSKSEQGFCQKEVERLLHKNAPPHFKLEDWRTVIRLMLPEYYMATIDLEDAYLQVPIHEDHRKFLRFQLRGTTYEYNVLPFGLSTAPFIFTKVMRPVLSYLRQKGLYLVIYLDDFLLLGSSLEECQTNVSISINLLSSLGFCVNYKKSQLIPSTTCKYLGFVFDSCKQSISIPMQRRERLLRVIPDMALRSECSLRDFASMIGSLISICPAVQYGLLYTKMFERAKFLALRDCDDNYSARMKIPSHLCSDFNWWIRTLSKPDLSNTIRSGHFVREIFSDASLNGWGAAYGVSKAHGWWSEEDRRLHINALELKAAFNAILCFACDLSDCNLLLRIDNTTAIAYINKFGSIQFPHLSEISRQIWQWCEKRNIYLFASYIASIDNYVADAESRITDPDTEWSLSSRAFQRIDNQFGPFDLDIFASVLNTKCEAYVSWFLDPGSFSESSHIVEVAFPGGRNCIREAFRFCLTPSAAIPTIMNSLSEATVRQYTRPLRLWWNFCQQRQVPLFLPSFTQLLEFLALEAGSVSSYSSLNTMRSAISLISINEIGQNPALKRFCRGFASIRPPRPKYDVTWDPAPVIEKLGLIYPYEGHPLNTVVKKLVLLLALATGQRVQTIAALRLSQITIDGQLTVQVPDRIKTTAPDRYQPSFSFSRFNDHEELCVVRILEHYIERTRDLRPLGCDSLFISCNKPFKAVTLQTISRWIRQALKNCDIDISIFSAHSTRHASTSLAARKGVAVEVIKKAAGWTGGSRVFARFYNRPVVNPEEFSNAVLLP